MSSQLTEDFGQTSPKPKGEEFPIDEFDGVEDWNAVAWKKIQQRDSLAAYLAQKTLQQLDATYTVLNRTRQDDKLRDAIAKEIEKRVDASASHSNEN